MPTRFQAIIPKLPARDLSATKAFYEEYLDFRQVGATYTDYLMLALDQIELHFFLHGELNVLENYGMCYIRVAYIEALYKTLMAKKAHFPEFSDLETRPWGQKEFSIIDPDHNLLTFGEALGGDVKVKLVEW